MAVGALSGRSKQMMELTSQQKCALEQFRAAVADILHKPEDSDRYYLRWLRARKFNVQKALLMFRNVVVASSSFLFLFFDCIMSFIIFLAYGLQDTVWCRYHS